MSQNFDTCQMCQLIYFAIDGSYIFTDGSKHNTWTTFLLKNYIVPANKLNKVDGIVDEENLPHIQESIDSLTSTFVNENGEINMTLHFQYLAPNINVIAL
mgnify:FL=1